MSNTNHHLPSREQVLGAQVQTLLNICHTLTPYLLAPYRDEGEGWKAAHPELDGGAQAAATTAIIAVCDRLAKIANDERNWHMDTYRQLEELLAVIYAENLEVLKASKYAAQVAVSPVNIFKPEIFQVEGGFVAIYSGITGRGETAEKALQDFQHQFKVAAEQANTVVEVAPEKPKRKRKRS